MFLILSAFHFRTIQSAILSIHCNDIYAPNTINGINVYAASVEKSWRDTESTWDNSDATTFWQTAGADDVSSDRSDWGMPAAKTQISTSGVYNYTFNVTKLVQQDSLDNKSTFDFLLSAIGGMLQCTQPTANYSPELLIESKGTDYLGYSQPDRAFLFERKSDFENDILLTFNAADTSPVNGLAISIENWNADRKPNLFSEEISVKDAKFGIENENEFQGDYHNLMKQYLNYVYTSSLDDNKKRQYIVTISDHMYKDVFVLDKEINAFACWVNLEKI